MAGLLARVHLIVITILAMAQVSPSPDAFAEAFPLDRITEVHHDQHPLDSFELPSLSQLDEGDFVGDDPALAAMVATEDAHHETQLPVENSVEDLSFEDVRDDKLNSAKEKEANALKHFNYFLKFYCKQKKSTFVDAKELTFESTEENITLWDDRIGCFFSYLAKHARHRCDPSRERIAYNTATGYASSIKAYYANKFRTQKHQIPVFQQDRWKALRVRLLSCYEEDNRTSGKSLVNPHSASSTEDREAIGIGCIWLNSSQSAEFWHLNNTMTQYSGRGSEVALDRRSKMRTVEVNELHYNYHILQPHLKRHKFGKEQPISVYIHRDSMLQDYYFSLGYRIVVIGDDDDHIFPGFGKRAENQTEAKSDSKVSSLWSSQFSDLYKSFVCLSEKMNIHLTSHCHKKGASQLMAETPSVSGLAQIFRTGWEVRGFHSIFDYIVGSPVMQHQAGKAMSGWTAKIGDVVVGGQPPILDDIVTSPEKVAPFVSHVFINDVNHGWPQRVRELLVASIFRHYDEFCSVLALHPDNKFECLENHLFVATIKEKLSLAGVTDDVFDAWRKEVRVGFFNRNLPALAIQRFPHHLGDVNNPFSQVMMDPRCFMDHFNSLSAHYMGLHRQSCQQQTSIGNLTILVQNLQAQVHTQNQLLERVTLALEGGNQIVSTTAIPVSPSTAGSPSKSPPEKDYIKRFSVGYNALGKGCSISERFQFFFSTRARDGYERDKIHETTSNVDDATKKKIRNDFTRLKKTVKLMLLFCDSYPTERPSGDAAALSKWLTSLRELGDNAESQIRQILFPGEAEKTVSQSALTATSTKNIVKEWEKERSLPGDTPEEIRQWFAGERVGGKKKRKANEVS